MEITVAVAALIGFVMPALISVVKQIGFNKWVNLAIAAASCIGAGMLTVWARGELNWDSVLVTIVTIFTAAEAVYAAFWRDAFDNTLNRATSFYKGGK